MIKRDAWQIYKRSEGKINIVKESGKESTSQNQQQYVSR